ncbi:RDD family protein [Flavobacterium gawalongense]|uniref:RDD family protein n=1 Tax=Flavobacterium gawalongense TaxID=2594432 RepID=A0A553BLQ8_9FLAO|nr:RDD family protein [Flavobacterium gawalongense]TRX01199.1 RDD family protein [Flavobacterium gawalongense]TRX05276.1 RDD family protein [Flavobacterium gawalongense]TRX09179.1 RDD family protein [Flavobacterium gawalongense]TRX09186.1 RDD family protein [Flavobacterium gawalongense]TRX26643.1 RDD family protein [Flavobacterium gawalongense]
MENKKFTVTDDLLASKSQRLLNFIIDVLIIYIIGISIGTTIIIVGDLTHSYGASNWVKSLSLIENSFFELIILFFYYGLTEMYFSRTFAKYFTETLVVKHDGSKPNMKSVIIRTVSRLIPFEPFSFLAGDSRGWHDTLSVTYVVKKHEFIAKKKLLDPSDEIVV